MNRYVIQPDGKEYDSWDKAINQAVSQVKVYGDSVIIYRRSPGKEDERVCKISA